MGALSTEILNQRADAAQREWERWNRVAHVVVAAVTITVSDLRKLGHRLATADAQRECERMADTLLATIDGFEWIKSPHDIEMAKAKSNENQRHTD